MSEGATDPQAVMLNLFQHPATSHCAAEAWTLKQVQGDD